MGVPIDPSSSNTANRFAVLQNKVPAPRPDELRQQLHKLQAQMSGLERQLQNHDIPESSRPEGRDRPYVAGRRPHQDRQTWAPRLGIVFHLFLPISADKHHNLLTGTSGLIAKSIHTNEGSHLCNNGVYRAGS